MVHQVCPPSGVAQTVNRDPRSRIDGRYVSQVNVQVGQSVKQGDGLAVVESVKAASDVFAPVSGEVVGANADLSDTPETVKQSPERDGWFAKVKLANSAEV